jgi:ABC-2 type transport system ATP-binding protein
VAVVADLSGAVVRSGRFPLLSGVDLTISGPSLTIVTGANGSGKTSLLRLLGGLEPLSSGSGRVLDIDLRDGDRRQVRRRAGWLGHEGAFYDELSVAENLAFASRALGRPVSLVGPALDRVGLAPRADTRAKALSAGQRRRMALAWMIVRRPELWLLDEPYASLDAAGRELLGELLSEVVSAGATVIVTSHDTLRTEVPATVVVLAGGRVIKVGSP